MRMPFCLLALLGLAGCVAETPVTTTTTEVTRTVTTGPVATQPVTREVLVTQAPPPVRVETRTVAPRAELRLDEWLLAMDWRELCMGARALDCAPTPGRGLG